MIYRVEVRRPEPYDHTLEVCELKSLQAAKAYANSVIRMAKVMAGQGNGWGDVRLYEVTGKPLSGRRELDLVPETQWKEEEKDDDRTEQGISSVRPWAGGKG